MKKIKFILKISLFCILLGTLVMQSVPTKAVIIGSDDRESTSARYENLSIVKLVISFGGDDVRIGTGALISERKVLTSAHNLYDLNEKKRAEWIRAESSANTYLSYPIPGAGIETSVYHVYPKYIESWAHNPAKDFAVINLPKAVKADDMRYFKLSTNIESSKFLVLNGYSNTRGYQLSQWKEHWEFSNGDKNIIDHKFDTEAGQSGSPLYYWPGYPYASGSYIVAVHSSGNPKYKKNFAGVITPEIKKWIESR